MIFFRNLPIIIAVFFLVLTLGCSDPGPGEQAGEKIDETVESIGDALDPAGPAEKAGRKVDETMEDVGEALGTDSEN